MTICSYRYVNKEKRMTIERYLRLIAGIFILVSLTLGWWVSPWFFLLTAFVGLNLFQSGLTNWCPMMVILRKAGVEHPVYRARPEVQRAA
jgi:hypothetical protein